MVPQALSFRPLWLTSVVHARSRILLPCLLPLFSTESPPFLIAQNGSLYAANTCAQWSKISPLAKRLIRNMMCLDSSKRFTAAQVLEDPWLKQASPVAFGSEHSDRLKRTQASGPPHALSISLSLSLTAVRLTLLCACAGASQAAPRDCGDRGSQPSPLRCGTCLGPCAVCPQSSALLLSQALCARRTEQRRSDPEAGERSPKTV